MLHPSKLYLGADPLPFATVAKLARHVNDLRAGRPIRTRVMKLTTHDFSGSSVELRFDDTHDVLGFAVIGEPELDGEMQDALLLGQLAGFGAGRAA